MKFLRFTFPLNEGIANIGDFIQVMAARRFYDEYPGDKEILVWSREELNNFKSGGANVN